MKYEELGYMGLYARRYKPRALSLHRTVNDVFGLPPVRFIPSSIAIVQQKKIPDVSFWQGEINFYDMRQNTDALIIRAGQNLWKDSRFDRNWLEAKRHGIKRGSYWFYDDRVSPGKQAELWAGLLRDDYPEMEIWCDWENSYGGQYSNLRDVVAFMQAMERLLPGIKIGLYTGYFFFREHSNAVTHASQYAYLKTRPLFLAWYTNNAADVLLPNPWTSVYLWQFGTPAVGAEYGVKTAEIDMSYINLTEADFQRRYGGAPPPPEPEPGETMNQWYQVNATTLNIRDGAGASYSDIGDLHKGDQIETTGEPFGSWVKIARILRGGASVPVPGASAWCHSGYCVKIQAPEPQPEAEVKPQEITVKLSDGSTWRAVTFEKVG